MGSPYVKTIGGWVVTIYDDTLEFVQKEKGITAICPKPVTLGTDHKYQPLVPDLYAIDQNGVGYHQGKKVKEEVNMETRMRYFYAQSDENLEKPLFSMERVG